MTDAPAPNAPTILVANDQEWAARSLDSILVAQGYRVIRAYNGRQALERAAGSTLDAVILDAQMPDIGGPAVCETLRADPRIGRMTPIFITTAGASGRQERFAAYRAGAWEFFGHPLDAEAILLKLSVFLDAKAASDRVRADGLVDELTGLYNKRGLLRRGHELASQAARRREELTCLVLGPDAPALEAATAAAEEMARRVAELFRRTGRTSDAIGRVGLLQFAVIGVGPADTVARHLVSRVNDLAAESGLGSLLGVSEVAFRTRQWAVDCDATIADFEALLGAVASPVSVKS